MVKHRKGFALVDVIVGSTMLAIGLAVVISISSRSLTRQSYAEQQITASWLADELLSMALVVGPDEYEKYYPNSDRFDPPFDSFSYEITFDGDSEYYPVHTVATIYWGSKGQHLLQLETDIARVHGEPVERLPAEEIDREARYWEGIEGDGSR
jgi:Tfp pilus assembly protein PilV|tara:strand:+ start:240 stop:698 length:459 start_codon:yes stop_codon:yes gene_type:complete